MLLVTWCAHLRPMLGTNSQLLLRYSDTVFDQMKMCGKLHLKDTSMEHDSASAWSISLKRKRKRRTSAVQGEIFHTSSSY